MTLDVRTIVVLLIVSSVLMTLTLAAGARAGRGGGFAKWNIGLGLYALGWLLVAARGTFPDIVTHAFADALLLAGLCHQLGAVIEFSGGTPSRWLLYAPAPLLFLAALPVMNDYPAFTLLVSLSYATAFLAISATALRRTRGDARWMLAASYAAGAVVLCVRAAAIYSAPAAQSGLYSGSAVHAIAFATLFAITATGSIAFLLMLRERAEAEIRHLAMFDPLTELFNRRAFVELAERELARARRAGSACAVLMMDLDHFKRVNDQFGHQAGDRVLREFAAIAKQNVRTEDVVGRYGGEEFCAVLPGVDRQRALEIAERVRQAVSRRPLGGLPRVTTVSIGMSAAGTMTLDQAIARADEALYLAKQQGRNRVAASSESAYCQSSAIPPPKSALADKAPSLTPAH
jgi:diguanylate cyclase (GGDEF)-like protein